ncbi:hypothetical protein D3C86_1675150 [compost metagenome]
MIVQPHFSGTDTQYAKQDPHYQQRHVEKEAMQRTQQQKYHAHHHSGHQEGAQHRKMFNPAEEYFHPVIQMPVLAQFK